MRWSFGGEKVDPYFATVSQFDRRGMRRTYRELRRYGVSRWHARAMVHGTFHAGYRACINRKDQPS